MKFEVTQQVWERIMGDNPGLKENGPQWFQCPVEGVSWNDIQQFISKLDSLTGKKYRLPTEAEWEFAARGGNKSHDYLYSGSDKLNEVSWNGKYNGPVHPVGQKQANELGLFDMSGNAWEWCNDWYDRDYYLTSPDNNPIGPDTGKTRVVRGGSWSDTEFSCRVSYRSHNTPDSKGYIFGFRLVLN